MSDTIAMPDGMPDKSGDMADFSHASRDELLARLELALQENVALEKHIKELSQDNNDLHLVIETTVQHADAISNQLHKQNLELERARLEAERANELKTSFLSSVTHELRTPLTSMMGFAKLIQRDLERNIRPHIPPDQKKAQAVLARVLEDISVVRLEGQRLMGLVNDVLDIAKIEAGAVTWDMNTLDLRHVVKQAVQRSLGLFEDRQLKMELPETPAMVTGDDDRLLQVLVNLIANAEKFSEQGDVICRIYQKSEPTGNPWVCCEVEDFGIGIAPEQQEAIFDKFHQARVSASDYTAKPAGTGLGLAICREIIDYHRGRLELRSALGEGSCFSFCLPALDS